MADRLKPNQNGIVENIAPASKDKLRKSDLKVFGRMSHFEKKEIVDERPIMPGLDMITTHVTIEIFDQYIERFNKTFRFNVRGIKDALAAQAIPFAMYRAEITDRWYQFVMENQGIEEHIVRNFPKEKLNDPGIIVLWDDDSSTMIDGNHRLVAKYRAGIRVFRYAATHLDFVAQWVRYINGRHYSTQGATREELRANETFGNAS